MIFVIINIEFVSIAFLALTKSPLSKLSTSIKYCVPDDFLLNSILFIGVCVMSLGLIL